MRYLPKITLKSLFLFCQKSVNRMENAGGRLVQTWNLMWLVIPEVPASNFVRDVESFSDVRVTLFSLLEEVAATVEDFFLTLHILINLSK